MICAISGTINASGQRHNASEFENKNSENVLSRNVYKKIQTIIYTSSYLT